MVQTATPAPMSYLRSGSSLLSGAWVRRPRVETRLDRALTRSLTVVTAYRAVASRAQSPPGRARAVDATWANAEEPGAGSAPDLPKERRIDYLAAGTMAIGEPRPLWPAIPGDAH